MMVIFGMGVGMKINLVNKFQLTKLIGVLN